MVLLAAEPARWSAMGRAGRAHIEARHDVRTLAVALERLYQEVRCDVAPAR
jgi:glycosyltransferase involved in cell wall biosynthesis